MDGCAVKIDDVRLRELSGAVSVCKRSSKSLSSLLNKLTVARYKFRQKNGKHFDLYFIVEAEKKQDALPVILFPTGRVNDPNKLAKHTKGVVVRCPYCLSPKCRGNLISFAPLRLGLPPNDMLMKSFFSHRKHLAPLEVLSLFPFPNEIFSRKGQKSLFYASLYKNFIRTQFGYGLTAYQCAKEGKFFICIYPWDNFIRVEDPLNLNNA